MISYNDLYEKNKNNNDIILGKIYNDGSIKKYSYKEVLIHSENISKKLLDNGINSDMDIIIYAEDGPEWCMYFLALFKIKSDAVLIDKNVSLTELNHLVKKTNSKVICCDSKNIDKVKDKFDIVFNIDTDEIIINNKLEQKGYIKEEKDAHTIIFSSGTSSKKSGIIHKTENIYEMIKYTNERYKLSNKNRFITIVSNTHIYGLSINYIVATLACSEVYYLESLDIPLLLKAINEIKPTYIPGVPKLFEAIKMKLEDKVKSKSLINILYFIHKYLHINLGRKIFKKVYDYCGKDICIVSAGSPLSKDTKKFYYAMGMPIIEFFGSTETGVPVVGTLDQNKYTHGSGTVIKPVQVKIDPANNELLVKNDYAFIEYLEKDNKKEDMLTEDGWLKTGDIAKIKGNNVYIIGRIKDTIMLGNGEKISPNDIEEFYKNIEGIKEYTVCGIPKDKESMCDEVHFFIVKDDKIDEKEIKNKIIEVSKTLSANMRPKKIHFVNEIPRTALGKPKRYILKEKVLNSKIK